jgi:hypothetical protein
VQGVNATAAAVSGGEFNRFVGHGNADSARGHMHMLDRAGCVCRGRAQGGGWRDLIAHEIDAAAARFRPQAFPGSRVFAACALTAAQNENAWHRASAAVD